MDVLVGLTAVSQALSIARELKDIDQNFDQAELKLKIVNLMNALLDTQVSLSEARMVLENKDAEIIRLKQSLEKRDELIPMEDFFYQPNADGKPFGMPICNTCLEEGFQRKVVQTFTGRKTRAHCNTCKSTYNNVYPAENIMHKFEHLKNGDP